MSFIQHLACTDLDEIRAQLIDRLEEAAEELMGPPSPETRRRQQWGWSRTGGAFLVMHGPKRGAFYCFSGGHGGPLDLIMFARSCDFTAAVDWAKSWLGVTDTLPAPVNPAVLLARAHTRTATAVEAEADERRRIVGARQILNETVPLPGTIGERYLIKVRSIPAPADGWPGAVRFHPTSRALVLVATDDGGAVRAVQRVYLTPDARKIDAAEVKARGLPGAKQTNGVMRGAVVRLPGPANGPLLLAEGAETGLLIRPSLS
jgi:hypothetical protein